MPRGTGACEWGPVCRSEAGCGCGLPFILSYVLPAMFRLTSAQLSIPLDTKATSSSSSSTPHTPLRRPGANTFDHRCKHWVWLRP